MRFTTVSRRRLRSGRSRTRHYRSISDCISSHRGLGEEEDLKFGLVGTGYWARVTHATVLASEPAVDFTAVWGRSAGKAAAVGEEFGARPYSDFADFLRHVDAVAFAVPPDVQAELGVQAAVAGKHLLLEKPVTTSAAGAERLVSAVERAGVASVVFFTDRFTATNRQWPSSRLDGRREGSKAHANA